MNHKRSTPPPQPSPIKVEGEKRSRLHQPESPPHRGGRAREGVDDGPVRMEAEHLE